MSAMVKVDGMAELSFVGVPMITPPAAWAIRMSGRPETDAAFARAMPICMSVIGSRGTVVFGLDA